MFQLIPKYIERQFTLSADFNYGITSLVVVAIVLIVSRPALQNISYNQYLAVSFAISFVIISFLVWRHIYIALKLRQRNRDIQQLITSHAQDWQYANVPPATPEFFNASLFLIAKRDLHTANYIHTADWSYMDISYAIYGKTRYGEYKAETIFYALMATELPRALPNVFFDSKMDQNREFKATFAADQRHQLEGNFNNYFDVYFAEGYTIDSLSFITPDVMQAMIQASEYDIEIVGNQLLLYGPMSSAAKQLGEMSQFIIAIKHTLSVTAAAYIDDRLPEALGARSVSPEGMFLSQKKPNVVLAVLASGLAILFVLAQIIISLSRT